MIHYSIGENTREIMATKENGVPYVVCLCGSTRFKDAFIKANRDFTHAGKIVLTVGSFMHEDNDTDAARKKADLDRLHLMKISLSDGIYVLNELSAGVGYIGTSTMSEIAFAILLGREIFFLHPEKGEEFLSARSHELGQLVAKHQPMLYDWRPVCTAVRYSAE